LGIFKLSDPLKLILNMLIFDLFFPWAATKYPWMRNDQNPRKPWMVFFSGDVLLCTTGFITIKPPFWENMLDFSKYLNIRVLVIGL